MKTRSKDKSVKLPDVGGWQDAIAVPAAIAGAILTTAGFLMAFLWAAPVNGAAVNGFEMIGDTVVTHQQLISQKESVSLVKEFEVRNIEMYERYKLSSVFR